MNFKTIVNSFLLALCIALVVSSFLMLLWNWLMPFLFGLPQVSFLQSLGIYVLCTILFKTKGDKSNGKK